MHSETHQVSVYVWSLSIVIVGRVDRNQTYNLHLLFTDGESCFINTFCSYSMIKLRYLSSTYITKSELLRQSCMF